LSPPPSHLSLTLFFNLAAFSSLLSVVFVVVLAFLTGLALSSSPLSLLPLFRDGEGLAGLDDIREE